MNKIVVSGAAAQRFAAMRGLEAIHDKDGRLLGVFSRAPLDRDLPEPTDATATEPKPSDAGREQP